MLMFPKPNDYFSKGIFSKSLNCPFGSQVTIVLIVIAANARFTTSPVLSSVASEEIRVGSESSFFRIFVTFHILTSNLLLSSIESPFSSGHNWNNNVGHVAYSLSSNFAFLYNYLLIVIIADRMTFMQ